MWKSSVNIKFILTIGLVEVTIVATGVGVILEMGWIISVGFPTGHQFGAISMLTSAVDWKSVKHVTNKLAH